MLYFVTAIVAILLVTEGVIQLKVTALSTNPPPDVTTRAQVREKRSGRPGHLMARRNTSDGYTPLQNANGKNLTTNSGSEQVSLTPKTRGKNDSGNHHQGTNPGNNFTAGHGDGSNQTEGSSGIGPKTLSPTDISETVGEVTPGGCKKVMDWKNGQEGYDKDKIAERFTLWQNMWGGNNTAPGSQQTVKCNKFENGYIDWTTSFSLKSKTKELDNQVKSYANVAWAGGKPVQIKALKKFESSWEWDLTGNSSGLVADVSYDLFTSKSATCTGQEAGCASHEIMIWLVAAGGAGPAGAKVPDKTVNVGGHHFEVYKGVVNGVPVISILPVDKKAYQQFNADFIPLLQTQLTEFGLDPSEYISTVGSGIEPFQGTATLNSKFAIVIE